MPRHRDCKPDWDRTPRARCAACTCSPMERVVRGRSRFGGRAAWQLQGCTGIAPRNHARPRRGRRSLRSRRSRLVDTRRWTGASPRLGSARRTTRTPSAPSRAAAGPWTRSAPALHNKDPLCGGRAVSIALAKHRRTSRSAGTAPRPHGLDLVGARFAFGRARPAWRRWKGSDLDWRSTHDAPQQRVQWLEGGLESM